ncbi:hypothetical protein ACM66B_001559 [Microbotryomycetes sp. NB124-2]
MGLFSNGDADRDKPSGTSRLMRRKSQPRGQSNAAAEATAASSRRGSSLLDSYPSPDSPSAAYEQPFTSSTMASRRSEYYGTSPDGLEQIDDGTAPARRQPLSVDTGYRQSPPLAHSTQSPVSYGQQGHERHTSMPPPSFQRSSQIQQQQRPQSQFIPATQPRSTSSPVGAPSYGQPQPQTRPMSYIGPPSSQHHGGGGVTPPPPANMYSSSPAGSRSQLNQSPAPSSSQQQQQAGQALGQVANRPQRQGSTSSRSTQQTTNQPAPPPKAPASIGGEPLHDLGRAVALLKSSKFYAEGFLMKKVEVGPDGKAHPEANESQWAKWFVQLSGTILSTWNAADMEEAARQNRTVPPQYLNLSDAFLHPYPPAPNRPAPTQFQFALNSAGLNRVLFCAPTLQSLNMWINAIRLAVWERSRCNEIYTGTLLGTREPKPNGWVGYDAGLSSAASKGKFEGWLKIRLPGDTEWRRLWTVVLRGSATGSQQPEQTKKNKRSSLLSFGKKQEAAPTIEGLPGNGNFSTVAFYADKPSKKEQPLCIAQHLFYAAAIYPESEKLINRATLFKVEGTFLNPNDGYKSGWGVGGRAEKQGYALLMLEEGDYMGMLEWIVGLSDAFKLYGRPRGFSWDPRDPSSMYFALPIGPHRDRLFLDRELVDTLDITESRPRAVRAVFHNILFDRMRGVRTQPQQTQDVRASAPNADSTSAAPQLGPVETAAPIKFGSDTRSEDAHERGGYSSRTESPSRRGLAPIGETSTASHHDSMKPAAGSSEQASWERQQQEQRDRERQWQDSQPPSSVGHARNGMTAEYHAANDSDRRYSVMPLHDTNSPSLQDHHSQEGGVSERQTSPPVVQPIVTNSQSGNALNFSRPTQQMLSTSPTASTQALDQSHGQHDAYRGEDAVAPPPATASVLPSPGAPSTAVPSSPSTALGYLGPSPSQSQGPFPGAAAAEDQHSSAQEQAYGNRAGVGAGLAAGGAAGAAVLGAYALHQDHDQQRTEELQAPATAAPAVSTPPLFSSDRSTATQEPTSPREYQPLLDRSLPPPVSAAPAALSSPTFGDAVADAPEPATQPDSADARRMSHSTASHGGDDIHSDLLAAINYVDRSSSPPLVTPVIGTPSTVEPSPVTQQTSQFHVGPPRRGLFANSPIAENESDPARALGGAVETLGDEPQYMKTLAAAPVSSTATPTSESSTAPSSFPSSFAPNKRAEERLAAAKLAEQSQQAALTRPGRQPGNAAARTKSKAWVDSDDDDEEPEEDDDESDDEPAPQQRSTVSQSSSFGQQRPLGSLAPNDPRRQSYLERGPSPDNRLSSLPPSPMNATSPLPSSPSKRELDLRNEQGGAPANLKPVVSPHGLLHAGILDKEERSARALEHQAREGGGPLVNLPSKPPPPQTGLVGAITSLEREKERTGGVGRALTEQQRERKLAEQRQRQLDELQRQQLQMQMQAYQQMQMAQFGGYGVPGMAMNMGSMSGMPSMPWMMPHAGAGGYGAFGGSNLGSPAGMSPVAGTSPAPASPQAGTAQLPGSISMDAAQFQQQQQQMFAAQQAAQAAAQAAYMQAMATFSQPPVASPGGSPPLNPTQHFGSMASFPSMQFSQGGFYPPTSAPMGMPFNQFGGFNPYQQQHPSAGLGMSGMGGANADADDEARGGAHLKQESSGKVPPLSMPPAAE